jgi:signal transduction histidine kinase
MRVRYLLLALVIICVMAVIFNVVLPWLGNYNLIWVGTYSAIFLTGLTSYAILKHHLMDISIVISRTVAEILAMVFFGVIYILMAWGYYHYISPRLTLTFLTLTILFGVLLVLAQQKIRFFLQTSADKLFLRGKYDYYTVLTEASSRVAEKLSLASILQILYSTFYNAVEVSNPRIFLPEHFAEPEMVAKNYILYDRQTYLPYERGGKMPIDDPLVNELVARRQPIRDRTDQDRLIIPCLLEDRLIAIFVLGPKISEDPYTNEDIRLLRILANQAAMAFDHARSYEKIKLDLALAERQLVRSERLASLGTLTAGVTHEIRNPLTVVRSETERIANKQRSLDELKKYRELVLKHVDRIAAIVQRMLAMAKEKPRQEVDVDINECINCALQLITISRVTLKKDLDLVPLIKGDPVEIEEVFVNLLQNAIHAMPDGGTLMVRSYIDEGRAVVEIADTGQGIPPELQEKIFDPFFSTRHEGVGLGLSIAYRIIREHGGDIRVKSEVGKGTMFKLLF